MRTSSSQFCSNFDMLLGNSVHLYALPATVFAETQVTEHVPGKTARMSIRPSNHYSALIPRQQSFLFFLLMESRVCCHFLLLCGGAACFRTMPHSGRSTRHRAEEATGRRSRLC